MKLKDVSREEKEVVCLLKEIVEREQQNALTQHEPLVEQHMNSMRSIRRRVHTPEEQLRL